MSMSRWHMRTLYRLPSLVVAIASILLMAGCGTFQKPEAAVAAPPTPSFESFMADADKARQESSVVRQREIYRAAAAAYPTRKEPWSKLAESYFEAGDYGNAITAAQEVLQRDASDTVASSLLAVSGLRVSTNAISTLRARQSLSADTRTQAEDIVKSLREALGETVLVPAPAVAPPAPAPAPRRVVRPAPTNPPAAPAAAGAATPSVAAPPQPAAPAKPPASPFERLR
jgi:hypothetical protein